MAVFEFGLGVLQTAMQSYREYLTSAILWPIMFLRSTLLPERPLLCGRLPNIRRAASVTLLFMAKVSRGGNSKHTAPVCVSTGRLVAVEPLCNNGIGDVGNPTAQEGHFVEAEITDGRGGCRLDYCRR